jgi:hypothetical protein
MATHSVCYYKEAAMLIGIGVKVVFIPTPHPSGVGSRGNSKVH